MKVITANLLGDGAVVYLARDGSWTANIADAASFVPADAPSALAAAAARSKEIAAAYLIDVAAGRPAGREALRETIRSRGPTVRPDLARQQGNIG